MPLPGPVGIVGIDEGEGGHPLLLAREWSVQLRCLQDGRMYGPAEVGGALHRANALVRDLVAPVATGLAHCLRALALPAVSTRHTSLAAVLEALSPLRSLRALRCRVRALQDDDLEMDVLLALQAAGAGGGGDGVPDCLALG